MHRLFRVYGGLRRCVFRWGAMNCYGAFFGGGSERAVGGMCRTRGVRGERRVLRDFGSLEMVGEFLKKV